jgi:hypothetical protein
MPLDNDKLWLSAKRAWMDPKFRQQLAVDAKGTLEREGIDTGNAQITLKQVDETNSLHIYIKNGGTNWSGAILLRIEK